jgi:dolichol-phosphate mannosyltransferase
MPTDGPDKRLTILIPALNEEAKIAETIGGILPLACFFLEDFEILLFDDGSTDQTGQIMDRWAEKDPRIKVIHHGERQGLGVITKSALRMAKFGSLTLVPGDFAYQNEGIGRMFKAAGAADLVITYRDNQSDRSINRWFQSNALRVLLNVLFGYRLYDYHSMNIYPVKWMRQIQVKANGYGYQVGSLVSLLQLGLTYVQVPVSLNEELKGSSRALRPRTYLEIGQSILSLLLRTPIRNIDTSQITAQAQRIQRQ